MNILVKVSLDEDMEYFISSDCEIYDVMNFVYFSLQRISNAMKEEEDVTQEEEDFLLNIYEYDLDLESISEEEYDDYLEEGISEICLYVDSYDGDSPEINFGLIEKGKDESKPSTKSIVVNNMDDDGWYGSYDEFLVLYHEVVDEDIHHWKNSNGSHFILKEGY